MNKNKRIGDALQKLAESLKDAAFNVELIKSLLLEKESVPAPIPTKSVKIGNEWSTKLNKWVPVYENRPVLTAAGIAPKCNPHDNDDWKNEMTKDINEGATKKAVESVGVKADDIGLFSGTPNVIKAPTAWLKGIGKNKNVTHYKITQGQDKGAVITVKTSTGVLVEDGRYGKPKIGIHPGRIAVVSKDQDGIDYVNRVIRQQNTKNPRKLVRMYRPNQPYHRTGKQRHIQTHCVIYKG